MAYGLEQALLIKDHVHFLSLPVEPNILAYCDNQATIHSYKWVSTKRSKYLDVSFQYVRNYAMRNGVKLDYAASEDNPADLMTKIVQRAQFNPIIAKLVQFHDQSEKTKDVTVIPAPNRVKRSGTRSF